MLRFCSLKTLADALADSMVTDGCDLSSFHPTSDDPDLSLWTHGFVTAEFDDVESQIDVRKLLIIQLLTRANELEPVRYMTLCCI